MGNGVSVKPGRPETNLFENDTLLRAAQKLSNNKDHHKQFVAFLQDGIWLDKVGVLSSNQSSQYETPSPKANFLSGYILPETLTERDIAIMRKVNADLQDFTSSEGSEKTVSVLSGSPPRRRYQNSEKTVNLFKNNARTKPDQSTMTGADYTRETDHNIRDPSPPFSKKQILKILVSVAYPLFEEHCILKEAGQGTSRVCFLDREGQCCCAVPCVEPVLTSEALQIQGMFLTAAAHFSNHRIASVLSTNHWIHDVKRSFDDCALGIFISDAHLNTNYPLLYANSALEAISGYSAVDLIGMSFQKQYGPATEEDSIKRIQTALQSQQSTRVVLTSYRANGSTFVSALAVKPVFNQAGKCCFVIGVICDISNHDMCLQELEHVDTVMSLLPLVLAP